MLRSSGVIAALAAAALVGCSPHAGDDAAHETPDSGSHAGVDAGRHGIVDAAAQSDGTTLPYDGGAVRWDGWADEFFDEYCVSCHSPHAYCVDCHMPGDPRTPDYSMKAPVVAHAAMIRCGVGTAESPSWSCGSIAARQFPALAMPPTNPVPSDVDRDRIEGWFDAGCP
jgi:hypothetical protein